MHSMVISASIFSAMWQVLNKRRNTGSVDFWFLPLVAERPAKVAVGFNPRSASTPNHLVSIPGAGRCHS